MDSGWDVKHMVREIVTSRTYRQASTGSKELLARDPDNRWLARQSRFRLDAELIRDNALAISGLLVRKIGGPSVKPYQPDGYWENLNFPHAQLPGRQRREPISPRTLHLVATQLPASQPAGLRRADARGMRRRPDPVQHSPASLGVAERPEYVEAARALAARIVAEGGSDPQLAHHLGLAASLAAVAPARGNGHRCAALVDKQLAVYREDKAAAADLLKVGQLPRPAGIDPAELAAWTSAARVLLNLHETITRN